MSVDDNYSSLNILLIKDHYNNFYGIDNHIDF
jgi:hypothetical protein